MKSLAELLRHLSRPGVTELTLATGRPPMIRGANGYEPVDPTAATAEDITRALQAMVGVARASTVTETPVQWSVNATGLGALSIAAMRRGDLIHLRLSKAADAGAAAQAAAATARPAAAQAASAPAARPVASAPAAASRTPEPASAYSAHAPASAHRAPEPASAYGAHAPASAHRAPEPASAYGAPASAHRAPEPASAYGAPASASAYRGTEPAPASSPSAAPSRAFAGAGRELAALLEEGRRSLASDVHIIAERPPLFRVAGELTPQGPVLDAAMVEKLLLPVVPDRLRLVLEREGSCDFSLETPEMGRFRVNVGRQRTGLKGTFRLIAREVPTLASLGLPADIAKATHHHQGLIVITGPSGHGKTSTLAALVDLINRETSHHVLTVEDPVEYVHPRKRALISQREVGSHTKTFASALKGSLREDPDVIVVGELRDTETVRMALSAAETGHLLISTMNTPSAAKTIDRLIDLFPPGDQQQVRLSLSSGLRLIVSQRLMQGTDGKLVAAAEVLPGSVSLGNLIRDNKTFQIPSLQQRGKSLGIVRFEDSLADLVRAGKVKLEVAKGFADNPDELEAVVTGKRAGATVAAPESQQDSARLLSKMGSLMGRKGS
ncbi:type IV pilus twitching motility protein PilT [Corallococcus macrosporus]|uniref:Twitching motility protein n=1 Tax=Corallococcus macrosporus DSM 14697 TaxID=1189310 RepID=A0A250K4B0_9BACT|nr:PilT/PilU family type 4a pilus ATPase [Corallococcus macrosporus]ATB50740.1 twitching motility protein [Corallococcus macrosporus DSM 14697]